MKTETIIKTLHIVVDIVMVVGMLEGLLISMGYDKLPRPEVIQGSIVMLVGGVGFLIHRLPLVTEESNDSL